MLEARGWECNRIHGKV